MKSLSSGQRHLLIAFTMTWLCADMLTAFEAQGTLQSVDAKKRVVKLFANGRERILQTADQAQFLNEDGKPLEGGLEAKELTNGVAVTVTVSPSDLVAILTRLQLGKHRSEPQKSPSGKASVGLKPLSEMTAEDRYKGEDGGLYGAGQKQTAGRARCGRRTRNRKNQAARRRRQASLRRQGRRRLDQHVQRDDGVLALQTAC